MECNVPINGNEEWKSGHKWQSAGLNQKMHNESKLFCGNEQVKPANRRKREDHTNQIKVHVIQCRQTQNITEIKEDTKLLH